MSYPANLIFQHQEKSSRPWALFTIIPIKILAILPHFFVLMFLGIVAMFAGIIGIFAVLFTGKYPQSFENLIVGLYRWGWRIGAYFSCMTDKYPPFTLKSTDHPADLAFQHQEKSSRLWALLTIFGIKMIVLIPHMIIMMLLGIVAEIAIFIGFFVVLFAGKYPQSFEKVIITYAKYAFRINTYLLCLTDKYPPFPWKDDAPEAPQTPEAPQAQEDNSIKAGESV